MDFMDTLNVFRKSSQKLRQHFRFIARGTEDIRRFPKTAEDDQNTCLPGNPPLIFLSFSSRWSLFFLKSYFFSSSCVYGEKNNKWMTEWAREGARKWIDEWMWNFLCGKEVMQFLNTHYILTEWKVTYNVLQTHDLRMMKDKFEKQWVNAFSGCLFEL